MQHASRLVAASFAILVLQTAIVIQPKGLRQMGRPKLRRQPNKKFVIAGHDVVRIKPTGALVRRAAPHGLRAENTAYQQLADAEWRPPQNPAGVVVWEGFVRV